MRLAVVLTALAATAGLGYRAFQDELARGAGAAATRATVDLADGAITTTGDLRAALHAYIAPEQIAQGWIARGPELLGQLQSALASLAEAEGAPAPLAAEAMRGLTAAEKRARGFVRDHQDLLAADVVFTDSRAHLETIRQEVEAARERIVAAGIAHDAATRREQYVLIAAIVGVWLLCALALLQGPAAATEPTTAFERMSVTPPHDDMPLAPPPPAAPAPVPEPVVVKMPVPPPVEARDERGRVATVPRLPEAAQVCVDLARASDGAQIGPLLARAADVLDAAGLIVWAASTDGRTLVPAAACGYDERMLARVGSLPRDAENLTAAAFRDRARRTSSARPGAPAALAVPLIGPDGPIGVLSGEVRHVERIGETTSAIASIFAAQLATIVGSMPPAEPDAEAAPDAAAAADGAEPPAAGTATPPPAE